MSGSTGAVRIAATVARRRALLTAIVVFLGATLSISVTAFAAIRDSSTAAIRQSIEADFGYGQYALQSGNPAVRQKVAVRKDASPVVDNDGTLTAGGLTADVLVRSTTDPSLKLGVFDLRPAAHQARGSSRL